MRSPLHAAAGRAYLRLFFSRSSKSSAAVAKRARCARAISSASAIAALEARAIREALAATGGNKLAAARLLGIARAMLYEKLATLAPEAAPHGA